MKLAEKILGMVYVSEMSPKEKKKLIEGGKSTASMILDSASDRAKEYFGGWPEDVVSKEEARLYWNTLYKELAKLAKEQIRK